MSDYTTAVPGSALAGSAVPADGSFLAALADAGPTLPPGTAPTTWPRVPLPLGVEVFVRGAWLDITHDVSQDGLQITRGISDEGAVADPQSMKLKLRNTAGTYSPRNPTSPLFGQIGRNTPIRAWIKHGQTRLLQPGGGSYATTAAVPALDITGDIDLRVDVALPSWRPSAPVWAGVLKAAAYGLWVQPSGQLVLQWYSDATTPHTIVSTDPVPALIGRLRVRAVLDVNNGASGHAVAFYWMDPAATGGLGGTWRQLGATLTIAGTTQVATTTTALTTPTSGPGEVFAVQVRNGINGTLAADATFAGAAAGQTFTGAAGRTWTAVGSAEISARHYRFWGEVSAWPQRWEETGAPSVYTPIECSGIRRRLGQGASPVQSALRRALAPLPALESYWPLEDAEDATELAAVKGWPARVIGSPRVAGSTAFAASAPIPSLGSGRLYCKARAAKATGQAQIRCIVAVPDGGVSADTILARIHTSSSLGWVDVLVTPAGGVYARGSTNLGVVSYTTGTLTAGINGKLIRLSLELRQVGTGVETKLVTLEAGATSGLFLASTKDGLTLGAITAVDINPTGADIGDLAIGHVTVERAITSVFDVAEQLAAYAGERADHRIARLCADAAVPSLVIGAGGGAERLGAQRPGALLDLLDDAADADGGVLFEPRDGLGLAYRPLDAMTGQAAQCTITYTDNLLDLEPVDDDRVARNLVTVSRTDGASSTVEVTAGPLGTARPEDGGAGIYDESVTLSLATDAATLHQAGWRANLGTVDESRWPTIGLKLEHPVFLADPALTREILSLDVGDRLDVLDLPGWLPPDDVQQVVRGYSETITPFSYEIEFGCSPYRPLRTGVWSSSTSATSATTTTTTGGATPTQSDDFVGVAGGALASARWAAGQSTAGATALLDGNGALLLSMGSVDSYNGRISVVSTLAALGAADVRVGFVFDSSVAFLRLRQRATGDGTGSDAYDLLLTRSAITPGANLQLRTLVAYADSPLATAAPTIDVDVEYLVRWVCGEPETAVNPNAFRQRVKVWPASEPEPTTWTVDVSDPAGARTTGQLEIEGRGGPAGGSTARVTSWAVYTGAGGVSTSTTTTVRTVPDGARGDRWSNPNSRLAAPATAAADVLSVEVTAGPLWTTRTQDFPFRARLGGEVVEVTAITGASSPQAWTVIRSVNGVSKQHGTGTAVDLADPIVWAARPGGASLVLQPGVGTGGVIDTGSGGSTGGTGTGSGGGTTTPPNTVRIGSATYPLSGINPTAETNPAGAAYAGFRGVDQLVIYQAPITVTSTNAWGAEVTVGADGRIVALNDRQPGQVAAGTSVPSGGYVLSGHNAARDWLLANAATPGALVELVGSSTGGTGGSTGGSTGTPGSVAAAWGTPLSGFPWHSGQWVGYDAAKATGWGTWRGAASDITTVYPSYQTWTEFAGGQGWIPSMFASYAGRLNYDMPLLPQNRFRQWADVTSGAHDADFLAIAQALNSAGRAGRTIVLVGVEVNGDWFGNSVFWDDIAAYKAAFARVVGIFRGVSTSFKFGIGYSAGRNPTNTPGGLTVNQILDALNPGDAYWDYVGVNCYDHWDIKVTDDASFQNHLYPPGRIGLGWAADWAAAKGKGFCVPEWGCSTAPEGNGDNPLYIAKMHAYFVSKKDTLAYECYFNEPYANVYNSLWDKFGDPIFCPNAGARYRELFTTTPTSGGGGTGTGGTGTGGTGGSTGGGGGTTPPSAYPAKVVSVYKMMWSVNGPNVASIPSQCNEIRFAFAQGSPPGMVGWGSQGQTSLLADVQAKYNAGTRFVISVGGQGGAVNTGARSTFLAGIDAIISSFGGNPGAGNPGVIGGLDWDVEASSLNTSDVVYISTQLKAKYGRNFAITFVPNGGNVSQYLPTAVACYQAGACDNYGQQFYDATVSLSAAKGRIQEALNAGLPQSVMSVGMMVGSSSIYWTNAQCASYMADIRATWPNIRKAYLWEAQRAGTAQWAADMDRILG